METRETIALDTKAQQRVLVLAHLLAGELSLGEAAEALALSERQVRRLSERFENDGAAGLLHRNRGRAPANRIERATRVRVVELAQGPYKGFNPVHLSERLAEESEPIELSGRSVRRILVAAGLRPARTRRRARAHPRRERMVAAGMLLQADGSSEDWLDDRAPRFTLVAGIDDATSAVTGGTFRAAEDAAGYFELLTQTAHRFGLPVALYTDRHGIFTKTSVRPPTLTEQLTGRRSLTQVGRALEEAGITWIGASSAQAKGRAERLWRTFHDRLRSELRHAKVDSIEAANELLGWYLPRHNARFGVAPANERPAWRPWSADVPPEAVFCFQYRRRIEADDTLNWDGQALALPARSDGRAWGRRTVLVEERLDGSLWARLDGGHHELRLAPPSAPVLRARHLRDAIERPTEPARPVDDHPILSAHEARRPARPDHPWRRYPAVRPR